MANFYLVTDADEGVEKVINVDELVLAEPRTLADGEGTHLKFSDGTALTITRSWEATKAVLAPARW